MTDPITQAPCQHPSLQLQCVGNVHWYLCSRCGGRYFADLQPMHGIVVLEGDSTPAHINPGA